MDFKGAAPREFERSRETAHFHFSPLHLTQCEVLYWGRQQIKEGKT